MGRKTVFLLGLVGFAVFACGPAPDPRAPAGREGAAAGARPAKKQRTYPALPPPPVVTTAMQGAPTGAALTEARLVATTCEKVNAEQIDAAVKKMKAEVDQQFKTWHATQPDCWAEDREETRWRSQLLLDSDASLGGGGGRMMPKPAMSAAPPSESKAPAPGPTKSAVAKAGRASGTNNQVAGVDEADFVKNDGRYVYIASNGSLKIIEALAPKLVSTTKIVGNTRELFVEGDRAVVYSSIGNNQPRCTYGYDCVVAGDGSATKVDIYDLTSRAEPKLVRELLLSGSLIAARRIGRAVHTVVADNDGGAPLYATWPDNLEMCGVMENVVKKRLAELKTKNEAAIRAKTTNGFPTLKDNGTESRMCSGVLESAMKDGQSFTTLVSFDLLEDKAPAVTSTVMTRPGAVFAGQDALYVSVAHHHDSTRWYSSYPSVDEVSEIHKFKIGENPKDTHYVGSGTVAGHVLNQFSMDEWSGYLRIATTKGRVPDPNVSSAVSIFTEGRDGNLVRVGAVDKIAPGEDIRAVRFDDERAYVVTFKKTDPLFVLDLYQPASPRILGELKIPGFSTYIHRMDPEHLLSIGFDANDHGDFAYFDGVILQLFDVKNPTKPKLVHKEKIGTRGSSSAATTDHLAFNFFASEGLLAVPMTICEGGGDGSNGNLLAFSGLLIYDVDVESGFKRLGGVDHAKAGGDCNTWWSSATSHVKRSIFLDDLVYSVAPDRVKVQRMSRLGTDVAEFGLAQ